MGALISFLVIVVLSLMVERIASVALTLTGLSRDAATFQVHSAFTGTGFTTSEAEQVVGHPARRHILMLLMSARSFELVTGVTTLLLAFIGVGTSAEGLVRGLLLAVGLALLGIAASSKWLDRHLAHLISWVLRRWTTLDVRDYTTLLGLTGGHSVLEVPVSKVSWTAQRQLDELGLPEEGVRVLAIKRADGAFVGAPHGATVMRPGDTLILYGRTERLAELAGRQAGAGGDEAHRDAVEMHTDCLHMQDWRESHQQQLPVRNAPSIGQVPNKDPRHTPRRTVT